MPTIEFWFLLKLCGVVFAVGFFVGGTVLLALVAHIEKVEKAKRAAP